MASEPLDPNKYHVLDKKKKVIFALVGAVLIGIVLPLIAFGYYKFSVTRPSQKANETIIEIRGGESVTDIAQKLYRDDAINSEALFKFYVVLNNIGDQLQAGIYTIPGGSSIAEVAMMLQHGRNDKFITFIEGWRAEEFATKASEEFEKIDYQEFAQMAKENEGHLFPDTYSFNISVTEEEILNTLVSNFDIKTADLLTEQNLNRAGLTKEEVIIIASIVEREVHSAEDKPMVAGILIRRWRDGELLGADATTQYAAGPRRYGCPLTLDTVCPNAENVPNIKWWPNDLTIEELELDHPYNTRAVAGLPPKPISNPGLSTIEAVLNYQESEYYYYLTDEEGVTHYARTLEEHNQNILNYL